MAVTLTHALWSSMLSTCRHCPGLHTQQHQTYIALVLHRHSGASADSNVVFVGHKKFAVMGVGLS